MLISINVKQKENQTDKITSVFFIHSLFNPSIPADLLLSRLSTSFKTSFIETSIPSLNNIGPSCTAYILLMIDCER